MLQTVIRKSISKPTDNKITQLAYPNPVTSELSVTLSPDWQKKKAIYEMINVNGQPVQRMEAAGSNQAEPINVSNLSRGFYHMMVSCNGESATQKIIR